MKKYSIKWYLDLLTQYLLQFLSTRRPLTSKVIKCISLNNKSWLTAPALIVSNPDEYLTFHLCLILIDMMK